MINVNQYLDRDILTCPICCNEFNFQTYLPICVSCGHTLCKGCVASLTKNNIFICPMDKKRIIANHHNISAKNQYDNFIILKLLRIINLKPLDLSPLTNFSFYYCKSCDDYISNAVYEVHEIAGHNLQAFNIHKNEKILNYHEKFKDVKNIYNFLNDKELYKFNIFLALYYYYLPEVIKKISLNNSNIFHNEHIYEKNYSFLGHNYSQYSNEYLKEEDLFCLTKFILNYNLIQENKKYFFKKGVYISKDSQIHVHGLFLYNEDDKIIVRCLGIFKDESKATLFFGIIDFALIETGYSYKFCFGMLLAGDAFLFGKFSNDFYPLTYHIYGEDINIQTMQAFRKNSDYLTTSICKEETIYYNSYFNFSRNDSCFSIGKLIKDKDIQKQILYCISYYFETDKILTEKSLDFMKKIIRSINLNHFDQKLITDFNLKYIEINYLNSEQFKNEFEICPINSEDNFWQTPLSKTLIKFIKPFAFGTCLKFINDKSFILSNFDIITNSSKGYYILLDKNFNSSKEEKKIINEFFELSKITIFELYYNLEHFINLIVKFLILPTRNFLIYFQEVNHYSDNIVEPNYFIDSNLLQISFNNSKENYEKKEKVNELMNMKMFQIFPDINKKELQHIFKKFWGEDIKDIQGKDKYLFQPIDEIKINQEILEKQNEKQVKQNLQINFNQINVSRSEKNFPSIGEEIKIENRVETKDKKTSCRCLLF
jgi:hypothetical protein